MGNVVPIALHPYMTTVWMREGIEVELTWLEDGGYIVRLQSEGLTHCDCPQAKRQDTHMR